MVDFDASDLPVEFDLPVEEEEELILPDLYVGLDAGLLAPGDGIVTDRHHASSDRYEADDPQNQIAGQISPFALSGWLRHGCEAVLQAAGASACHPGESNANFRLEDVYDRDLDSGYHEKDSCTGDVDAGCVVYDLFGGFGGSPGKLIRRPVSFSPVRSQVDVTKGEAEAHYRQLHTQVRSRNDEDGGQPLRHSRRDVIGNLEGTWKLTLRETKPEFVGLLLEAIAFLDAHSDEYAFQLGGARNFGAGMVDAEILNPLYTADEVSNVYDRRKSPTNEMERKDELWQTQCRDKFVEALQARTARRDGDLPVPDGDE
jgi:hypothetical protein